MDFVEILIMGKKYQVPSGLTVQKAFEYAGFQIIRGCGCRGGVCGACAILYRTPEDFKIRTALACFTLVQEGMMILNLPYFPSQKAIYDLEKLTATDGTLLKVYPEMARCLGCNTCTKMCPQNVPVMEVVAAALRGDIERAAKLSVECVMCGLCAARCPGELLPHYIALLTRRLHGRYMIPPYRHVMNRLRQLESGEYDRDIDKLMELTIEQLREEYKKAQADKRVI
jgi:formate hydrogenlyase subunit 6/NADH:ubiquinone oxidoreductase subunit I